MTHKLLDTVFKAVDDKRAEDIVVLNMQGISLLSDYFLICTGSSERQVQAIARRICTRKLCVKLRLFFAALVRMNMLNGHLREPCVKTEN